MCLQRIHDTAVRLADHRYPLQYSLVFSIVAYLRLVVLALGFQYAARSKGLDRSSDVLNRSVECAKSVIRIVIEHLYPTGNLRYAMEANFVYVSFAAAYLVNVGRLIILYSLANSTSIVVTPQVPSSDRGRTPSGNRAHR